MGLLSSRFISPPNGQGSDADAERRTGLPPPTCTHGQLTRRINFTQRSSHGIFSRCDPTLHTYSQRLIDVVMESLSHKRQRYSILGGSVEASCRVDTDAYSKVISLEASIDKRWCLPYHDQYFFNSKQCCIKRSQEKKHWIACSCSGSGIARF